LGKPSEIVDDFIEGVMDSIKDFFHDLFKGLAEDTLQNTLDMLQGGLKDDTSDGGIISQFITTHPANFTGGGGTSIWSTIESICTNAVVPLAGMILTIVLAYDLIQMVISGNNMRNFDISIIFKWVIKAECGYLLVSNVYYIASGIFSIGNDVSVKAVSTLLGIVDVGNGEIVLSSSYSTSELIFMWLMSLLVFLAVVIMLAMIVVVSCSRMIEIFMYLGVSPVPMATFANQEWRQIGNSWLRGVIALAFQGFFIIVALGIFSTLFTNAVGTLQGDEDGNAVMQMLILLGYALALIFTVLRTGQISKSMFGAH